MASSPFDESDLPRLALDLAPSGMLAVDGRGHIVLVNREIERLFGWSREELAGKSIEHLVPERYRGAHPGHRASFFGTPHTRPMGAGRELHGLRKDGTEFPVEIGLNPVHTGAGLFVLASVVDITARRSLDQRARQSQKLEAIGTLAGGIAHDFNNILLSIVGFTELSLDPKTTTEQRRDDLQCVLKAADRGRQLVQRILAFSRKTEMHRAPVQFGATVNDAVHMLRASLPSTIEIRVTIDPASPLVLSDETQIQQIVMNLATNAAHAMPDGGVVTITVARFEVSDEFARVHPGMRPGPHVRLVVADRGAGMTPEVLQRATEPFFTTKPPGVGTGLGLSVIHGIVTSHQGILEIESEPSRGTTVSVYLPAAPDAAAPAGAAAPSRSSHILLVEDEADLALMQRRQLVNGGYRVTVHTSSVDALDDFKQRPNEFDLLITDNTMPRMTGLALAQHIAKMRPELPILMVSGIAEITDAATLRAQGIHRLLPKPHTWHELDAAIRELLKLGAS